MWFERLLIFNSIDTIFIVHLSFCVHKDVPNGKQHNISQNNWLLLIKNADYELYNLYLSIIKLFVQSIRICKLQTRNGNHSFRNIQRQNAKIVMRFKFICTNLFRFYALLNEDISISMVNCFKSVFHVIFPWNKWNKFKHIGYISKFDEQSKVCALNGRRTEPRPTSYQDRIVLISLDCKEEKEDDEREKKMHIHSQMKSMSCGMFRMRWRQQQTMAVF